MPDRPYTDTDVETVARAIHDHACPGDPEAGCNWHEDGPECDLTEFDGFARAALAAAGRLTRPGVWEMPSEPGPEVVKVWDDEGGYCRLDDGGWVPDDTIPDEVHITEAAMSWRELLFEASGSLSATPPTGTADQVTPSAAHEAGTECRNCAGIDPGSCLVHNTPAGTEGGDRG